jgi:hypothetical protein
VQLKILCFEHILLLYCYIICMNVFIIPYNNISLSNKNWLCFVTDSNGCTPFTICVVPEALHEFLTVHSYKYFQGDRDFGSRTGFRAGWLSRDWLYRGADYATSLFQHLSIHRSVFSAWFHLNVRQKTAHTLLMHSWRMLLIRKLVSQFHRANHQQMSECKVLHKH